MSGSSSAGAGTLVIGGGVVGLTVAYELLRRGRGAVVIERDRIGHGATLAAGGMLAPVAEADIDEPPLIRLGRDSLDLYPRFIEDLEQCSGIPCRFRTEGTLWVASNRDDRAEMDHLAVTLEEKSLPVTRLSADELLEREPHLSGRVLGGLLIERDLQVDPRAMCRSLAAAIQQLGGTVLEGHRATEVLIEGETLRGVQGEQRDGTPFRIDGATVVVAAGAWSGQGLHLPVGEPRIRPVKGQLVRLRGPNLLDHVIRTPDLYLIPREDGELLIGASVEEMGFDEKPTAGAVMDLLRHAWEVLPACYDLELAEVCVGLRPATEDQLPAIGPTEVSGLILATGHFRSGVLLAPATAVLVADCVLGGDRAEQLTHFAPARILEGAAVRSMGSS